MLWKPVIVGHRGAAGLAPENTVPAFQRAYELGVRTLELDVRLTADGVPVVIHDATVDRTTSGRGPVNQLSVAEIRTLDAGGRFGIYAAVPSLAEALAATPDDASWFIELKRDDASTRILVSAVVAVLTELRCLERSRLISFHEALLAGVRAAAPDARLGVLAARDVDAALETAERFDCEAVMLELGMITEEAVARCHAAGRVVTAWTANTAERVRDLARLGADEITTDYPDVALRALAAPLGG